MSSPEINEEPKMKTCKNCAKEFPETLEYWYINRKKPDGRITLRHKCKECYISTRKAHTDFYDRAKVNSKTYYHKNKVSVKQRRYIKKYKDLKEFNFRIYKQFLQLKYPELFNSAFDFKNDGGL